MSGFSIRTYGCQMNVHDTAKVANLLHHAGFGAAPAEDQAELLLINTCSIREKAEHKLYSDLGALRAWKSERPGRVLAVGGCVAQQEGDALLRRFGHVDFVFGTHNLRLVPELVAAARTGERTARVDEVRSQARFDLPERHPLLSSATPGRALLTVMEGCDMFCSFCIVPTTRGREISRPAASILAEAREQTEHGAHELTLLGQTVNAYGRHDLRRDRAAAAGTLAFGELLTALAQIPGVARLRYLSPHPIFFDDALIRAHAEIPALCPHVHLPLQSGSDRVLEGMRRRYTAREYVEVAGRLRAARPEIALSTDVIVGFPGETGADFEATLAVMREVAFVDSYSFKYSPRPGTAAATAPDQVAPEVAQERLERLQALQRELTLSAHRARLGLDVEVLVEGASRRRGAGETQQRGRTSDHRLVNFRAGPVPAAPGALVRVRIVDVTPHSLIGELPAPPRELAVKPRPLPADEGWRLPTRSV